MQFSLANFCCSIQIKSVGIEFDSIQGGPQKSMPLSRIIIKLYLKTSVRLHLSSVLSKNEHKNVMSLC